MTKYDERLSVDIKAVTRIAGKTKKRPAMLDFPSCGIETEKRVRVVWVKKEETHRYLTFLQSTTCGE